MPAYITRANVGRAFYRMVEAFLLQLSFIIVLTSWPPSPPLLLGSLFQHFQNSQPFVYFNCSIWIPCSYFRRSDSYVLKYFKSNYKFLLVTLIIYPIDSLIFFALWTIQLAIFSFWAYFIPLRVHFTILI